VSDDHRDAKAPLAGRDLGVDFDTFAFGDLDIDVPPGEITAIIGPNGSGKTTLLRTLARLQEPDRGVVYLDGDAIAEHSTREVARRLAILPQSAHPPEGVTVEELVAYGRHPHKGLLSPADQDDREAIAWALDVTETTPLADREVDSLSGGERQRAWIAMALAQETDILLLDEPTNHLDLRFQVETLSLVRSLNRDHGLTVGWVLHDLNQAAAYSDRMVLMHDGEVARRGTPEQTMTPDVLEEVFGLPVTVTRHPTADTPFVIPLDPGHADTVEATMVDRNQR
jgi:iron complex transport system ATP-binding protein